MQVFTQDDLDARYRETRAITARLFESSDYQEWLKRSLRPKLELLKAEVMRADLLTDTGRIDATQAQIQYNTLFKFLEDDLHRAGIAEEAFRKSLEARVA